MLEGIFAPRLCLTCVETIPFETSHSLARCMFIFVSKSHNYELQFSISAKGIIFLGRLCGSCGLLRVDV